MRLKTLLVGTLLSVILAVSSIVGAQSHTPNLGIELSHLKQADIVGWPFGVDELARVMNAGFSTIDTVAGMPVVNPQDIIPNKNGHVLWVDGNLGSNAGGNNCRDYQNPCLTINGGIAKAGDYTGDAILVFPIIGPLFTTFYTENVVVNKGNLSIISAVPAYNAVAGGLGVQVFPASGAALTVQDDGTFIYGIVFVGNSGCVIQGPSAYPILHTVDCTSVQVGNPGLLMNTPDDGGAGAHSVYYPTTINSYFNQATSSGAGVEFRSGPLFNNSTANAVFRDNVYLPTGVNAPHILASNHSMNGFYDTNSTYSTLGNPFFDFSATTTASDFAVIKGANFANSTGYVLGSQFKLGTGGHMSITGSYPNGDYGISAPTPSKTVASNLILTGGVLERTASGSLQCTEIVLETDATGLASGTNLQIVSNASSGRATLCAETVANLGANKSIKCSGASVTPLVPFTLADSNTLTLKCTGANCTGAGTIKVTPICTRLSNYASAN